MTKPKHFIEILMTIAAVIINKLAERNKFKYI